MKSYKELTKNELLELKNHLEDEYKEVSSKGLKLDMSRGKPSSAQLEFLAESPELPDLFL